jgi:hypothetical protein
MDSIYDKTGNEAIIARINALTPETKAVWGKMSVDQMFKHVTAAIEVAFGTKPLKINFLMKLLGRMLKNKVFNSDFKKNSPTAPEFIFTDKYDFEVSKKDLIDKFRLFTEGHQSIKVTNHPFWGKMTYEDWDKLMWRHMDHHLRQFGV